MLVLAYFVRFAMGVRWKPSIPVDQVGRRLDDESVRGGVGRGA